MFREVEKVLVTRGEIAERVRAMATEMVADLRRDLEQAGHSIEDEGRVVLIPIMTGALVFVADLIRELPVKLSLELVVVSSYAGATTKSKGAALLGALPNNLRDKHVLILDDILDSGQTMDMVLRAVGEQAPASVRAGVLLNKRVERVCDVRVDYTGFEIPDEFVVGYGLDYDGYYRNLPDIVTLAPGSLKPSE